MIKRFPLSLRALAPFCLVALSVPAWTQEANEKAQRYYDSLLKRPVPGAAFDRFYGAWLDTETLESLEKWLTAKADAPDAPAGARLLLAYFYSRQSEPAKAIAQFSRALAKDPENAEAWYQKAMASARLLDPAAALKDLEKAARAKPSKLLAAQIRQAQGRLLARQGQPEEARKVWQELLAASPDDEDLAEDLIDLQMTEGLYDDALASTQKLLENTKDAYKKVQRRLRLGGIYLKSGKRDEAVKVWRSCLEDTGSDSWLEKEILAQLEQAFRREDAMEPLMREMADLSAKYPQRLTLRRHYAKLLAETGDIDGAVRVYRGILELAPGERSVREGFIDLLKTNKRPAEAVEQLRELARLNPQDLELLARLADLEAENGDKAAAKETMALFLTKSDQGEAAWLRVAAAWERYGLAEDALAQYQRAAGKFPDSAGVREAWAVALHAQGKKEEAFKGWRELAKGADASRLAAVARSASARGEHALAYELLKEREPDFARDPVFLTLLCDEAAEVEKQAEALPWALRLVKMSRDAVELESTVSRCLKLADQAEKTDDLRKQLQAATLTPQEKCLLAELLDRHADSKAADALLKEVAAAEPELATALLVRLQGQRNDHAGAADSLKKLIESPGGRKSAHVQRLVELYRRAGKTEEALAWIPEWKKLSPGSVLPWQTEAELQTETGKGTEALRTLRQASQEFEGNEDLRALLASAYRSEGQLADAQRIYMALYENAADTPARIRWAGAMAEVAKEAGKTEELIETFEQRHKANRASPAPLLALAEIHRVTENYDGRRKALLEAVRVKPGDAGLLMEMARISEREEKYDDALETLREALPLDKSGKVRQMISRVLFEAGREDEGVQALRESFSGPPDALAVEDAADSLVNQELWGRAADFLLERLPDFPDNYRLHYYCAVALEQDGRLGGEFDPDTADRNAEPGESGTANASVRSTAGRKTGAVDLFLKVRAMTRELPAAAMPTVPAAGAAKAGPDFYAELAKVAPVPVVDIMRLSQAAYQAYQYRSQSSRPRTGGGGLSVPPALQAVRSLALVHLISVSAGLSETGRARLAARLEADGLPQAQWMMDAGLVQTAGASQRLDLSEPLEKDPGNAVLNTLQVLWAMNNPATTEEQLLKSQAALRERWPVMAQMAALGLMRGETPEARAEFGKVVDFLAAQEKPPGLVLMNGVTQALYQINNRRGFAIPEANRAKFAALQSRILPWLRADSQQRQNLSYVFLQLAAGLADGGDLGPLVRMLEEEIAYWNSDPGKKAEAGRIQPPGAGPVPPVAQELDFPPARLPDFPVQVLQVLNGQGLRAYGLTLPNDPEPWKAALPGVKDPVLRVLVAQAADDDEAVKKAVEALNSGKEPNLSGLLLAAGLAGKDEKYAEAAGWLLKARDLPMAREVRRMMDSSILAWSLKVIESDPQTAENDPVRQAGRESALRLRRENLNATQRSELADALETLGLAREAERLTAAASNAGAGPRGMTSGMMISGARGRSQLQMLVDKGKRAEAVKVSLKQLRDFARLWAAPNDGSVRYTAQEWLQEVRRGSLLRDLQEAMAGKGAAAPVAAQDAFAPESAEAKKIFDAARREALEKAVAAGTGENENETAAALAQRAAAWDILGDAKTAIPLYRKALALKPKDSGVRTALALALLTEDPKAALPLIAEMDPAQFPDFAGVIQNTAERFETFEARFSLLETVAAMLDRITPEQAARQDMSWALYLMENVVQQGYSGRDSFQIGSLYEEDGPQEGSPPDAAAKVKIAELQKRRLALHETLCRRMMRLPGLAEPAFRRFAGVILAGKLSTPTPEELDALALEVLKVEARQRSGPGSGGGANRRYYYSNNKAIRLPSPVDWLLDRAWELKDGRRITDQVLPVIRAQGAGAVRDLEQQQALYFCPEADFQKAVGEFLRRRQSSASPGEPTAYLETALRVMNLRGLRADFTDALVASVEALNANYVGGQELFPVLDYAEYLMDKKTPEEAREFLTRIAAATLGPKARRREFLDKNHQPNNGFSSSASLMVYRWIQMLRAGLNRPLLVLPMYAQAETEFVPYLKDAATSQPLLHHYGSAFQRPASVSDKPQEFLKFISTTPLTGGVAVFRSYPDPRQGAQSPVVELLQQMSRNKKRKELADALGTLPKTFGTELMTALMRAEGNNPGEAAGRVLGAHLEEIKALPPERWADFTLLRKNFPGSSTDPGVKAFDEWDKSLQARSTALEIDKFLAAKDAEELAKTDGQLSALLQPVLAALLADGDPRLAEVLAKVRLMTAAERRARAQMQGNTNDGSSVTARMLGAVLAQAPASIQPDKATRAVTAILNAVAAPEGFPIEWSRPVSAGFDRLLAVAALRTADGKKITRLQEFADSAKLGDTAAVLLFGPVRRLLGGDSVEISPEDRKWLAAADPAAASTASGMLAVILAALPPAAAAAEAGGGSSAAPINPPAAIAPPASVSAESWVRARLSDQNLPLPVRLGLAAEALRIIDSPAWPTAAAAADLLAESWKAGHPVMDTDSSLIVSQFNEAVLKGGESALTAAREPAAGLAAAWRKSLTDALRVPGSYGYRPMPPQRSGVSRAFLSLFLTLGDTGGLNSLLNAVGPQVDRSWLAEVVAGGQEEAARRLLSPMRPGIQASFQARGNDSVKFSKALADHLPAFLAGIADERARILAEALLVSLPDPGAPAPESKKSAGVSSKTAPKEASPQAEAAKAKAAAEEMKGVPDRHARLTALVERVPLEAFKTRSELEPLMALLSGETIESGKMTALISRYLEGDSLAAASLLDDQTLRELRCGLLRKEVVRKLKAGDIPAVEGTLRELEEAMADSQNYYPKEEARKIYPLLQDTITAAWNGWKPPVRLLVRNLWLSLSLDAGKGADMEGADGRRLLLALFLYALEDDMSAFTALVNARPAAVREDFAARLSAVSLQDGLDSLKYPWAGGTGEIKARKAAVFLRMITQPAALPGWKNLRSNYFKAMEESGWVSGADILGRAGELLAKGPQNAAMPGELAVLQAGAGQLDEAARNLETSRSRLTPGDSTGAAGVVLLRATLLEKKGQAVEAVALVNDFRVPDDLPVLLKRNLTRRGVELGILAALQTGGPEKMTADFVAPLTEKPRDAAQWMKLRNALNLAGRHLMDKGDPAAAANWFGMAAVMVNQLDSKEPKQYREQLEASVKGWRAAALAAGLPGHDAPAADPGQTVRKLDPAALAAGLGKAWAQLPAAFRDAVLGGGPGAAAK
ncbi:MAG: tetratricopeptide repeat protein [Verrucomicrobiota bacterium]